MVRNPNFRNIQEIWYKNKSLNVATGAICSTELKQNVRKDFEKNNKYSYQAFGFDIDEIDRAKGMKKNNPKAKPIFPLINELLNKKNCIKIIQFLPLENTEWALEPWNNILNVAKNNNKLLEKNNI